MRTVGMGIEKKPKHADNALKQENKKLKKEVDELAAENTAMKAELEVLREFKTDMDELAAERAKVAPVQQNNCGEK